MAGRTDAGSKPRITQPFGASTMSPFRAPSCNRRNRIVGRNLGSAFAVGYSNGGHLVFRLTLEAVPLVVLRTNGRFPRAEVDSSRTETCGTA